MRTVTVSLGGQQYTINQLPMRAEAEWRKALQLQMEPVLALVRNYDQIEFNSPADVAQFLQGLAPLLLDAPDLMLQLLFAYSPVLALAAAEIEAAAFSDEVWEALKAVMGLAYPFARDLTRLSQVGSRANGAAPKLSRTM